MRQIILLPLATYTAQMVFAKTFSRKKLRLQQSGAFLRRFWETSNQVQQERKCLLTGAQSNVELWPSSNSETFRRLVRENDCSWVTKYLCNWEKRGRWNSGGAGGRGVMGETAEALNFMAGGLWNYSEERKMLVREMKRNNKSLSQCGKRREGGFLLSLFHWLWFWIAFSNIFERHSGRSKTVLQTMPESPEELFPGCTLLRQSRCCRLMAHYCWSIWGNPDVWL